MSLQEKDNSTQLTRSLRVIYIGSFFVSLIVAPYLVIFILQSNNSLSDISSYFFVVGGLFLAILFVFEIIRRIAEYIILNKPFLSFKIPPYTRIVLSVSGVILVSGLGIKLFIEIPKQDVKREKLKIQLQEAYVGAKDSLLSAKQSLSVCMENQAKSGSYFITTLNKECSRKKEIERGLYNDCRGYGSSHALCISLNDYEAINCEEFTPNPKYISCSEEQKGVNDRESFIKAYESDLGGVLESLMKK